MPIKFHVKEQPQAFERFKALWTPTQIIADADGVERHRIEGFLNANDFLAELELGLGRVAFEHQDFRSAEHWFHDAREQHPDAAAAPQARYWEGVSAYKATNQPEPLQQTERELRERYPDSEWARRASVWAH